MKILYVIHSLTVGGAETIVTNYLIRLKEEGQDVVLIQMEDKKTFLNQQLSEAGIRVLTAGRNMKSRFLSKVATVINFCRLVKKEKPDIIHVHTGLEKFRYIHFPAERIVYTMHSEWARCIAQGKNHKKMLFQLLAKGMSIIVLNEDGRRKVQSQFPQAKVYKIPNGFDLEKIQEQTYDKTHFLRDLNIPERSFILGHVGRFHPVKNHDKIVKVFLKVLEKRNDAQLLLVGKGNEEEEIRLRKLINESGASERIHMLGERRDATAVMSIFDCLIMPSFSEAFPLTLIEAQVLGIKAVVSAGIAEEVCVKGNCQRLSLEENDDVWAESVLNNCTTHYENKLEQYSIEKVIATHLQLYASLG